jgi:DNA methylase
MDWNATSRSYSARISPRRYSKPTWKSSATANTDWFSTATAYRNSTMTGGWYSTASIGYAIQIRRRSTRRRNPFPCWNAWSRYSPTKGM